MNSSRFIIIDGNSLLHRAWHALPPLMTKNGEVTNAVYGFTMILLRALKELKPDYLAVAFDTRTPTFRHQAYKEYKAQRKKQPDEFYQQIPKTKEVLTSLGLQYIEAPGFEADDIIGTLCQQNKNKSAHWQNIIVSGDLDNLQLINAKTEVYTFKKGITDVAIYDQKAVQERFGIKPEQMIDYKALRGDPSDNIPGVKGIGEKTALDLIKEFGSLENLYKNLDSTKIRDKVKTLLSEQKEGAFFSKKLVTIKKDVPLEIKIENLKIKTPKKEEIITLFQRLEFNSLLSRALKSFDSPADEEKKLAESETNQPNGRQYHLIDTQEKFENFLVELKKQKEFAVDTETTGLDPFLAKLLGISFSWQENQASYVNFNQTALKQDALNKLKIILENPEIKKTGHNIKYDSEVLRQSGINLTGIAFDTMLAAYLFNPGKRTYGLDTLSFAEFGYQMSSLTSLMGPKGKKQIPVEMIPHQKLSDYSCADADYTWRLKNRYEEKLKEDEKTKWLFEKMEMPLVEVLVKMEEIGLKIDDKLLKKMSLEVGQEIGKLEKKIYQLAGVEFNVNSPKQLKEILFVKLEISTKGIGKTKTGISTAATELEKLKDAHPIINLISEHRELAKIFSTYLESLPKLINPKTKRVHTSFNQTITATGRLSSSDPNLQNIPARTSLGMRIRQAFIAEKGYSIVSVDYSQIELRIIASLADDKKMIEFFNQSKDIHLMTAAEIKNVAIEDVTPEMRHLAKTVNFGVIYGLGKNGLAQSAGISRQEAANFIERYFTVYPEIKEYIEHLIDLAEEKEYAETAFGRKRFLPEINSTMQMLKAEAARASVNMPIQGLAADLIKLAMVELNKKLEKFGEDVKMILQVHDELLFEIKDEKIEAVTKIIKEVMESPPIKFKVPIKVEVKTGDSWGTLKPITNN